jgi:hypothetical protein
MYQSNIIPEFIEKTKKRPFTLAENRRHYLFDMLSGSKGRSGAIPWMIKSCSVGQRSGF